MLSRVKVNLASNSFSN